MTWLYQDLAVAGLVNQVAIIRWPFAATVAILVAQTRHAGEEKLHWDKTNKRHTLF